MVMSMKKHTCVEMPETPPRAKTDPQDVLPKHMKMNTSKRSTISCNMQKLILLHMIRCVMMNVREHTCCGAPRTTSRAKTDPHDTWKNLEQPRKSPVGVN